MQLQRHHPSFSSFLRRQQIPWLRRKSGSRQQRCDEAMRLVNEPEIHRLESWRNFITTSQATYRTDLAGKSFVIGADSVRTVYGMWQRRDNELPSNDTGSLGVLK